MLEQRSRRCLARHEPIPCRRTGSLDLVACVLQHLSLTCLCQDRLSFSSFEMLRTNVGTAEQSLQSLAVRTHAPDQQRTVPLFCIGSGRKQESSRSETGSAGGDPGWWQTGWKLQQRLTGRSTDERPTRPSDGGSSAAHQAEMILQLILDQQRDNAPLQVQFRNVCDAVLFFGLSRTHQLTCNSCKSGSGFLAVPFILKGLQDAVGMIAAHQLPVW